MFAVTFIYLDFFQVLSLEASEERPSPRLMPVEWQWGFVQEGLSSYRLCPSRLFLAWPQLVKDEGDAGGPQHARSCLLGGAGNRCLLRVESCSLPNSHEEVQTLRTSECDLVQKDSVVDVMT